MLEILSGNRIFLIVKLRDLRIPNCTYPNFMTKNWFDDGRKTFLHACIFLSNILPPMQGRSRRFVLIALIGEGTRRVPGALRQAILGGECRTDRFAVHVVHGK